MFVISSRTTTSVTTSNISSIDRLQSETVKHNVDKTRCKAHFYVMSKIKQNNLVTNYCTKKVANSKFNSTH